ncbi:MAG: O-antigen ligase C-terminal domain-containing protein [Oceanospirillaceae bacterium]|nr:O-antigen ligase C-terminal domain-containing protein [Oceanospirillaceae bacterium]
MPLLDASPHLQARHRVTYVIFTILFLIAPFYYQDNLGGEGLGLPFNAVIWIPVVCLIGVGLISLIQTGAWVKPSYLVLIGLFPLLIVLGGFASGLERPGEWIVRIGVLVGGILLWFALFQVRFQRRDVEGLLYILLAGLLLHGVVGLVQMLPEPLFKGWIPVANQKLLGMFQQPNLQASLMATAIALAIYLAAAPGFKVHRWPMKSLVFLTLSLASFEVVSSGSRIGLLSSVIVLAIVVVTNLNRWSKTPFLALSLAGALVAGGSAGLTKTEGAVEAYNKLEQLSDQGRDVRPHIYRIAIDAWERSPVLGHGIGSFQREFQNQRIEYYDPERGEVIDNARFSHPHNELLFWMIEGGVVALVAIACAVAAVFLQLYRLGWQRGGLTAALLLPITLHTQVELPFYISTFHWIVLVVLLFACFYPGAKTKPVRLSGGASKLITIMALSVPPLVTVFLMHSLLSQTGIMQYLKSRGTQPQHLNYALNNLYFREQGEYFMMRAVLYSGINRAEKRDVEAFVDWAEPFLEQIPDIQIFKDLSVAYQYIGNDSDASKVIERASAIYPADRSISEVKAKLKDGEPLATFSSQASVAE